MGKNKKSTRSKTNIFTALSKLIYGAKTTKMHQHFFNEYMALCQHSQTRNYDSFLDNKQTILI